MPTHSVTPIIVASENGHKGALAAMELLRQGGSALDAVELACRVVEDDPEEHSVGYGGLPNVLGQVELDASIMDGRTLQAGAVAGLQDYGNAISLARKVMEELPHVLLVNQGAQRLAAELGQPMQDQRTFTALERWRQRFQEMGLSLADGPLRRLAAQLTRPLNLAEPVPGDSDEPGSPDNALVHGTVNFLIRDSRGDLASGVSTSGLGWKYPGRVGDSPIIGAGNYCDNRYGAAACTGMGELSIRVSTARSLVLYLKMGLPLQEAGLEALRDLAYLSPPPEQYMNIVALTPDGEHGGFSTVPGKRYLYLTGEMAEPALADRVVLAS